MRTQDLDVLVQMNQLDKKEHVSSAPVGFGTKICILSNCFKIPQRLRMRQLGTWLPMKRVAPSQQHRLCRLLGVDRYLQRWPHLQASTLAVEELRASAVEHPHLKGEFLLLHRRRMPADVKPPCTVCKECRGPLTGAMISLPRYSLANDLWMGRQLPALQNLAAGTKRLLPMVRTCLQVTVLQPANLVKEERQRGFIGNSIILPQAKPSSICTVLPPPERDMQESILFVLVGQDKSKLHGSSLLQAPRKEYEEPVQCLQRTSAYYESVNLTACRETELDGCILETAAKSYLAKQLLQQGPADAQGQADASEEEADPEVDATAIFAKQDDDGGGTVVEQNGDMHILFLGGLL